jgi:hypothetical protein
MRATGCTGGELRNKITGEVCMKRDIKFLEFTDRNISLSFFEHVKTSFSLPYFSPMLEDYRPVLI